MIIRLLDYLDYLDYYLDYLDYYLDYLEYFQSDAVVPPWNVPGGPKTCQLSRIAVSPCCYYPSLLCCMGDGWVFYEYRQLSIVLCYNFLRYHPPSM